MTDRDELENDYARTPWAEILEGWEQIPCDASRGELWEPPGRTGGHAPGAAYTREHGYLYVFTTSTEFEARTPYSKFRAYAVLNHGGDEDAADAAPRRKGFAVFPERDGHGNQIVQCDGKYSYTWPADRERLKVGDKVLLPAAPAWAWERYGLHPVQVTGLQRGQPDHREDRIPRAVGPLIFAHVRGQVLCHACLSASQPLAAPPG